jgi:hypothetical protein
MHPQSDCGAKSQPCIPYYMAAGNVDGLEKQDDGESLCQQSVLLTLF